MISVIVPVYNVEQYLSRCIESILLQTYTDFELLLVDDGSKDKSGQICEEYAKKDSRIHVFHKDNGGLSDARNYGLDRMKGNYLTFIDSDDYIGEYYLEELMDMMLHNNADMSAVSFQDTYEIEPKYVTSKNERIVFKSDTIIREMMRQDYLTCSACGKLYSAGMFATMRFPKGRLYEDLFTMPYLIKRDTVCVYSKSIQYYYYRRLGSIMKTPSKQSIDDWIDAIDKLLSFISKEHPGYIKYAQYILVQGIFWRSIDWKLFSNDYKSYCRGIKRKYKCAFRRAIILPRLTIKERIKAILFYVNVDAYRLARIKWIHSTSNPDNKMYVQ